MCCHGTHNHSNFHAISCVAMGTVISPEQSWLEETERGRERSIFLSKPECLPTSPHAVFHFQINLSISPQSSASNHTSIGFICLSINLCLYKGWCMLWIYSRGGCSVYHFVSLYYWCSFYVPFDPPHVKIPLWLCWKKKKKKKRTELQTEPHAASSQPYAALVCALLTNCSPTNHWLWGEFIF